MCYFQTKKEIWREENKAYYTQKGLIEMCLMKYLQRGGQGNVELASKKKPVEGDKKTGGESLADKLKHKILGK